MNEAAVRLRDVTHRFGETPLLAGVELDVAPGEAVALLGRSGAGKTTLLNLVGGLLRPTGGEIRINGRRIDQLDADGRAALRRTETGFIFQQFNLIPTLTVLENLEFPAALARRPVDRDQLRRDLGELGLADKAGAFPEALSGGEQQRIAVLRALSHRPTIVLADEPTANLDVATAGTVMDLLLSWTRQRGAALLLVTHSSDLSIAMDRAFRIENRELVAQ